MENFSIIQALCRAALASPSSAIIHQIERLKTSLEKNGETKEAKSLATLLDGVSRTSEMAPSRIQRSFVMHAGEELTPRVPMPVDKESATPLAEVIFPDNLPGEAPLFDSLVASAIESILNEWRNFERLAAIGARPSRSCLIYGEPGTGKTHLALWIAKQMRLPVVLARLDGLMSSFLGTTSRNIGNLFGFANKYRCILLLDEFDAIAKVRNDPQEVGEIKRVVNTLLQNLDIRNGSGYTIGVTNHESLLDPAIWRRFEVQIEIPKPTTPVMADLLNKLVQPISLQEHELKFLSWSISGASGADAETLSRWLKRVRVLEPTVSIVDAVRRFAVLNAGRITPDKTRVLTGLNEDDLITTLGRSEDISFKQQDIAALLGIAPSTISKRISKKK